MVNLAGGDLPIIHCMNQRLELVNKYSYEDEK